MGSTPVFSFHPQAYNIGSKYVSWVVSHVFMKRLAWDVNDMLDGQDKKYRQCSR